MKITSLFVLLISVPVLVSGQSWKSSDDQPEVKFPRHYIAVNPLNMSLFQQIGVSYEYKAGVLGYGVTGGYIYPNHKDYSNYFIAGPTGYASLGDYSGFFVVPQVNIYLTKPKNEKHAGVIYIAVKMVYKNMRIDSTRSTAWYPEGDGYYQNRKMIDKVNLYGGFIDFGYRYVLYHFFFDLNFGPGMMSINHKMTIYGENIAFSSVPVTPVNPPRYEELHQSPVTINFTINLGVAF